MLMMSAVVLEGSTVNKTVGMTSNPKIGVRSWRASLSNTGVRLRRKGRSYSNGCFLECRLCSSEKREPTISSE